MKTLENHPYSLGGTADSSDILEVIVNLDGWDHYVGRVENVLDGWYPLTHDNERLTSTSHERALCVEIVLSWYQRQGGRPILRTGGRS